jgi:hypothetical protein
VVGVGSQRDQPSTGSDFSIFSIFEETRSEEVLTLTLKLISTFEETRSEEVLTLTL